MEEAVQKAKQSGNDEEVKRQVAAISSLCDVILDAPSQVQNAANACYLTTFFDTDTVRAARILRSSDA
ncbi:DUF5327 family protein [Bacillus sp. SL00103]